MQRKTIAILAALLLIAGGVFAFLRLRHPVRRELELAQYLPPDMDLYSVIDFDGLAANPGFKKLLTNPGIGVDEDYKAFIQATGFHYEKDLHRAAVGRSGDEWVGVARAALDRARAVQYMESQGARKTEYQSKTIYAFGKVRPLRLVFLEEEIRDGGDLIAFTIGGDAARIEEAADLWSRARKDSAATQLERQGVLDHVDAGSNAWAAASAEKLWPENSSAQVGSFGLSGKFFHGSRTIYASLHGNAAELSLSVEDVCDDEANAKRIAGSLQGLYSLLQAIPERERADSSAKPVHDDAPDLKSALSGIVITQTGSSIYLRWKMDESVLKFLEGPPR